MTSHSGRLKAINEVQTIKLLLVNFLNVFFNVEFKCGLSVIVFAADPNKSLYDWFNGHNCGPSKHYQKN
jgi:hypothetical protein